jgi:hypothetical protein
MPVGHTGRMQSVILLPGLACDASLWRMLNVFTLANGRLFLDVPHPR